MNLYVILFVVVTIFLLLIKLVASLTGRVSERLLTSYFRDLEALVEHGQLPPTWGEHVRKLARDAPIRAHAAEPLPWEAAAKAFLLKKIGTLYNYFQTSPFVESPETRALLLEQLDAITKRWEESELSEILADYQCSQPPDQHELFADTSERNRVEEYG